MIMTVRFGIALLVGVMLADILRSGPDNSHEIANHTADARSALRILDGCPNPVDLSKDDLRARNRVMDAMKQLARYEPDAIRGTLRCYAPNGCPIAMEKHCKVFVLNRYYFNVPFDQLNAEIICGFVPPDRDRPLCIAWPLVKHDGVIHFTGEMGSYLGGGYDFLREFDEFERQYGRRGASLLAHQSN